MRGLALLAQANSVELCAWSLQGRRLDHLGLPSWVCSPPEEVGAFIRQAFLADAAPGPPDSADAPARPIAVWKAPRTGSSSAGAAADRGGAAPNQYLSRALEYCLEPRKDEDKKDGKDEKEEEGGPKEQEELAEFAKQFKAAPVPAVALVYRREEPMAMILDTGSARLLKREDMDKDKLTGPVAVLVEAPLVKRRAVERRPVVAGGEAQPGQLGYLHCGRTGVEYQDGVYRWCVAKRKKSCKCDGVCGPSKGCQCAACYAKTWGPGAEVSYISCGIQYSNSGVLIHFQGFPGVCQALQAKAGCTLEITFRIAFGSLARAWRDNPLISCGGPRGEGFELCLSKSKSSLAPVLRLVRTDGGEQHLTGELTPAVDPEAGTWSAWLHAAVQVKGRQWTLLMNRQSVACTEVWDGFPSLRSSRVCLAHSLLPPGEGQVSMMVHDFRITHAKLEQSALQRVPK